MSASPAPYPHLNVTTCALLEGSDKERIRAIRAGTWLAYRRAREILELMEGLLDYPKIIRMPNILLVAPSFNGKTSILRRFLDNHPPSQDPAGEVTICPVLFVESPPGPNIGALYIEILDKLQVPYKTTAGIPEKLSQILKLFKLMDVRILILDEIHHLISGSVARQQEYRNALKSLGNAAQICIVASGTEDAHNAFSTDPQMRSRFRTEELPKWAATNEFGSILATLEQRTPLRLPSNLKDPRMMMAIHLRSEGMLGDICDLVKELAIDAIRNKTEQILLDRITTLKWAPPSHRKQQQRH